LSNPCHEDEREARAAHALKFSEQKYYAALEPLVGRKASFRMLTLYDMDRMSEQRADAFLDRLEQAFLRF
jgi:hypothetical protein